MTSSYDFMFKFIVIGDTNVGKSCLSLKFTQDRYQPEHEATLGVEFASKNIKIGEYSLKIQIWDTAGQESFKSITRSYYKGSIAAFIVYDISKRDSFEGLPKWLQEVRTHAHQKVEVVMLGNKCDLEDRREVSFEQGQRFAEKNGFHFHETSAKKGQHVEDAFRNTAQRILKKIEDGLLDPDEEKQYGLRRGKSRNLRSPVKIAPAGSNKNSCC